MNIIEYFAWFYCLLMVVTKSLKTYWEDDFDYFTYLDANDLYKLYWTNLDNNSIEFGIEVKATGWIALGISPNGNMPHSDIMFAWVDDNNNQVYLQDRHTKGWTYPILDQKQDLTMVEGEQVDGYTRIRFIRPKFSCDDNDESLSKGTTRIIYAWSPTTDPSDEFFDSTIPFHENNRGSHSLNFDTGIPNEIQLEDDVEYLDLLMNNLQVPSTDTTYYCKLFELPIHNETHHIVQIDPIITPENEGIIHHIVTYLCPTYFITNNTYIGHEDICDEWDTNMKSKECILGTINFAWAIGGNSLIFPNDAGLPMSGNSGLHYMIMEIHYDNPELKKNIIDFSGVRIWYTSQLREYDAGLLTIGSAINPYGQFIPQGMDELITNSFCTSDCTINGMHEETYVFGSLLHAHTIATALNLRIIRDNKELKPIDSNWNYDFNYQQIIQLNPLYKILPGDEFIIDC
eukprot:347353_1